MLCAADQIQESEALSNIGCFNAIAIISNCLHNCKSPLRRLSKLKLYQLVYSKQRSSNFYKHAYIFQHHTVLKNCTGYHCAELSLDIDYYFFINEGDCCALGSTNLVDIKWYKSQIRIRATKGSHKVPTWSIAKPIAGWHTYYLLYISWANMVFI